MTRYVSLIVALALLFGLSAFAQNGTPSSQATAAINNDIVGCTASTSTDGGATMPLDCHSVFSGISAPVGADNFVDVMTAPMKVSNSQSIFASPSLVTGLYTNTRTKTTTGSTSSATAGGGVFLRAVLKDPVSGQVVQIADPVGSCKNDILGCQPVGKDYGVTLDSRVQTLTQTISNCLVNVTAGPGAGSTGTCSFDSTIELALMTTSAHTFNFIFPNVGVGTYNVVIQAALNSSALTSGYGSAVGGAAFGLGSMTVQSVRLVHGFSF